ncbi:MAG: PaaI family thioesterase [Bacilli bacterium]|nr:PaaI family thioesterase [Bacilli bacterium]
MDVFHEGFMGNNHMELVSVDEGKSCVLKALIEDTSMNPFGIVHGGFIFGLGDTAMGVIPGSVNKKAVTLSSTISYLKPAKGSYLLAKATMIKDGKKTCFLRVDIYNDQEELVATMDGNYYYVD